MNEEDDKRPKSGPASSGSPKSVPTTDAASTAGTAYPQVDRLPVDRLMELASESKSDKKAPEKKSPNLPEPLDIPDAGTQESRENPMWKILLQLRPFLPYLARMVPLLDVAVGPLQSAGLSSDVRKAVAQSVAESTAKIQSLQRDLNTAVSSAIEEQSLQLTRLEEELTRVRQISDRFATAQVSIAEDLDRLGKLARISALGLGVLLVALIAMTAILLARLPH